MSRDKYFQLEKTFKGVANHRRLEILNRLGESPGLTLDNLSNQMNVDFRTLSKHSRRMENAGLIKKHYEGRSVHHELTYLGHIVRTFARTLEEKLAREGYKK